MGTEYISIDGRQVETLRERLRPGLRALFVGLNPSPVSVAAGHYYQGRLGQRLWARLEKFQIASSLRPGFEDDDAFSQGYGFTDVVRRPSARAADLTTNECRAGSLDLLHRLEVIGDKPLIVWVFKAAQDHAGPLLQSAGFETIRMPGPFAAKGDERMVMEHIRERLTLG